MYHRLEQAPSSDQIVPLISVIRVRRGPRSLCWLSHCKPVCLLIDWLIDCWLSHCIASERDCEPRGLYPDSLQPIESVPQNFNKHAQVDFLPKDKQSDLLQNKWIPPPPLELWLRKRLVCVCVWGVFASLTACLDLAFQHGSDLIHLDNSTLNHWHHSRWIGSRWIGDWDGGVVCGLKQLNKPHHIDHSQ